MFTAVTSLIVYEDRVVISGMGICGEGWMDGWMSQ